MCMDPLLRATLGFRRWARKGWSLACVVGLLGFLAAGGLAAPVGPIGVAAVALFAVLLLRRLRTKLGGTKEVSAVADVELGLLLALFVFAVLQKVGGLDGPLQPAVYVLVAFCAAFARPAASFIIAACIIAYEALLLRTGSTQGRFPLEQFGFHAAFAAGFSILNFLVVRGEVARVRSAARAEVEGELGRLKDDARRYRLLGAGEARKDERDAKDAEERLARSSVEEIHQSVHYALELLRRTLDLHTSVLLWQNEGGTHLRISELSTGADDVQDAPIPAGDGVLAAVFAQKKSVLLERLKPSFHVPYYNGPCPVRTLLAIPVMEDGNVRGILAIDRTEDRPFTPKEEELAAQAARYCHRAIQNERVFVQLERAKIEQGKLYRAAEALGAALSEKEVLQAAVRSAREIASFDLAAVTIFDEEKKMHEVCAATSRDGKIDDLVGVKFHHNAALVSMVVQNRFPLPYRGEFDAAHQVVLTRRFPWPKMPSLLVIPLLLRDRVLGTLILGAQRKHAFGDSVRPTLEVLARHLAVSLSNARMVQKLETMATTDGMTGLLNKRAMIEQAEQKISAAARFGRKLSVLVTDIDFFKKVNDTYGHDIGDVVIKGLGDILRKHKRTTDVVARFGGEEFVVLCEQTDEHGAMLLAERIREELQKTVFSTPNGKLQVTCSLGVATFPEAGNDWESMFKAADDALYVSKRGGRNQSTLHTLRRTSEVRLQQTSPAGPVTAKKKGTR
jgi:two-component system, cell cycle response regulator